MKTSVMEPYAIEQARGQAQLLLQNALISLATIPSQGIVLEAPKEAGNGDVTFRGAFALAKALKRSPQEVAQQLADALNHSINAGAAPLLEKAVAAGGYVNIWCSAKFFDLVTNQVTAAGKQYGSSQTGRGKVAVVEYSQPNVGKPMHVGHIRSTILGDSVKRLLAFEGYRAVGFNYLGDSGAQVAKLILATRVLGEQLPKIEDEKHLLAYYVAIHRKIEAQPNLEVEAQVILKKIESGDPSVMPDVEKIRNLSIPAFEKNYELLDVTFDEVIGESAFIQSAKAVVQECLDRNIAEKAERGEIVVKLEPAGLPNTILLRSNGTTLYLTRDLGLADYKWNTYRPDLFYICTDARQNLHFQQVFKTIQLLGRAYQDRLVHQGFGVISLPEGLMSTREGRVILLEDVLSQAIEAAKKEIGEERKDQYTPEQINGIARAVGIAATKFAVLRVAPEKNVVFDFEKMVRFSGDTGAYLQYTLVRTNSILAKAGQVPNLAQRVTLTQLTESERNLVRALGQFPLVVQPAASRHLPHVLCEYLLELASRFSEFYEKESVLKAETPQLKEQRLRLVQATQITLENGLGLLGIRTPEKM